MRLSSRCMGDSIANSVFLLRLRRKTVRASLGLLRRLAWEGRPLRETRFCASRTEGRPSHARNGLPPPPRRADGRTRGVSAVRRGWRRLVHLGNVAGGSKSLAFYSPRVCHAGGTAEIRFGRAIGRSGDWPSGAQTVFRRSRKVLKGRRMPEKSKNWQFLAESVLT